jgi:hypothetical protein
VPNKTTALLKDAILQAAAQAGGKDGLVGYLMTQASANPQSFLPLLGKVLPMQVTGEDGGPLQIVINKPVLGSSFPTTGSRGTTRKAALEIPSRAAASAE